MEKRVSAITEDGSTEVRAVRKPVTVYGTEKGLSAGRAIFPWCKWMVLRSTVLRKLRSFSDKSIIDICYQSMSPV